MFDFLLFLSCNFHLCNFAENRILDGMEVPLNLQLNYGGHRSYMELRIIQIKDSLSAPPLSSIMAGKGGRGTTKGATATESDSDETISDADVNPKEEGKQNSIIGHNCYLTSDKG